MDANDAAATAGISGAFENNSEQAELSRALAAMGGPEFRYRSFAQSPGAVTVQGAVTAQGGPDPSHDLSAPDTLTAVQEAPRRATPVHTPVPGALSQFPLFASALAEASDVAVTSGPPGSMTAPMAAPPPVLAPAVAMMTTAMAPAAAPPPGVAPPPPAAWPAPAWGAAPPLVASPPVASPPVAHPSFGSLGASPAAAAEPASAGAARSVPMNEVFRMLAPHGGVKQPSPSSPLRDLFRRLS